MSELIKFDYSSINSVIDREKQAEISLLNIYQLNIYDVLIDNEKGSTKQEKEKSAKSTALALGQNWAKWIPTVPDMLNGQSIAFINTDLIASEFINYLRSGKGILAKRVDDPAFRHSLKTFVQIKLWEEKLRVQGIISDEAKAIVPKMWVVKEFRKLLHEANGRAYNLTVKALMKHGVNDEFLDEFRKISKTCNHEGELQLRRLLDSSLMAAASMLTAQSKAQNEMMEAHLRLTQQEAH